MKSEKVFFLDRDGVINKDIGYLHKISDLEFIEGIFELCSIVSRFGYKIIIVTNQSGIGRGYFSKKDFIELTRFIKLTFKQKGIKIKDIFYCPHTAEDNCSCRKPLPGMFIEAIRKYNIDVANSWVIGDSERDIEAAIGAGIINTILFYDDVNEIPTTKATYTLKSLRDIKKIIDENF